MKEENKNTIVILCALIITILMFAAAASDLCPLCFKFHHH
jgi:hypothetical protein